MLSLFLHHSPWIAKHGTTTIQIHCILSDLSLKFFIFFCTLQTHVKYHRNTGVYNFAKIYVTLLEIVLHFFRKIWNKWHSFVHSFGIYFRWIKVNWSNNINREAHLRLRLSSANTCNISAPDGEIFCATNMNWLIEKCALQNIWKNLNQFLLWRVCHGFLLAFDFHKPSLWKFISLIIYSRGKMYEKHPQTGDSSLSWIYRRRCAFAWNAKQKNTINTDKLIE